MAEKAPIKSYSKKEMKDGRLMAILSYLGILALIPFFAEKNNKYVLYHVKQGLNLFIWEIIGGIAVGIIAALLWRLWIITNIIDTVFGLAILALSLIGIVNVVNGKAKELPVINKFKFIK